jgi:hypothetical protein
VDHRDDLLNQRAAFKTELTHLTELNKQLHLQDNTAISLGKSIALTSLHDLGNYLTSQFQSNWRQKNKTLLTRQSPGETTAELMLICQYQDGRPQESLQNLN